MILRRRVARFSLVRHFPGSGLGRGAGSQDDFCVVPWYALLSKPAKSSWSLPEPVFCTVFHDFQGVSLRVSEGFRRGFLGVSKGFRWGFRGFLLLGRLFYLHGAHLYVRPSDTIIILERVSVYAAALAAGFLEFYPPSCGSFLIGVPLGSLYPSLCCRVLTFTRCVLKLSDRGPAETLRSASSEPMSQTQRMTKQLPKSKLEPKWLQPPLPALSPGFRRCFSKAFAGRAAWDVFPRLRAPSVC